MTDMPITILVPCRDVQEVQIVYGALQAHRDSGAVAAGPVANLLPAEADTTATLIEKALRDFPTNPQKDLLQRTLFEGPEGTWVSFDSIKATFAKAGLKASQASAALRDLSWQLGQVFPAGALAGYDANVCILAERMRSAGSFNYRLTKDGRTALGRMLQN